MIIRSLSVAAPVFNEADGIAAVVQRWIAYLSDSATVVDFEIVLCDDGSVDETFAILQQLATGYPQIRVVRHSANQGAAAALTSAIGDTCGEWVLLTDSDGQFPMENLARMTAALRAGDRAAIGVRRTKQNEPFARFGSWLSGAFCNLVHATSYRDFNCAFKLVQGSLIRDLHLEARGLNYSTEVTSRLIERAVEMVEVDITHTPRTAGHSHARRWATAADRVLFVIYLGMRQLLLRLRVLQRRTA